MIEAAITTDIMFASYSSIGQKNINLVLNSQSTLRYYIAVGVDLIFGQKKEVSACILSKIFKNKRTHQVLSMQV